MRARTAYAAGISAAALAVSGLSVGAATASTPAAPVAVAHSSTGVSGTPTTFPDAKCNTAAGTWASDGITAQDGAPTNPSLNTWGAKQVRCARKLNVGQIVVGGYPNQSMNINFNIEVYKKKNHATVRYPNSPQPNDGRASICSYTSLPGTYAAAGVSGAQWTINLPTNCTARARVANKGVWFAIQADLDQAFGQWFWATQTTADHPDEADWRDTQNLFGLNCISFIGLSPPDNGGNELMQDCIFGGDVGQKDFIMVLN